MSDFKKRNIIIGALCGVLLLMIVGYAAFQSVLNIKGTANITSNWNVLITGITESNRVGDATSVEEYPQYTELSATFKTNLVSPGDSITYDVTIENQGDIDAKLEKIILPQLNNEAIIITTSGVEVGSELNIGDSAVLKVKVEYNPEITSQPKNTEASFEMILDYVQKDKSEITPQTVLNMKGIEVPIITEGDGLYNDPVEPGRYVYKGTEPDNYITFNDEEWRIIAVETDGTIKIMKNPKDMLPNRVFDNIGARTTGYCSQEDAPSYGCSVYAKTTEYSSANGSYKGTVDEDSEIKKYLEAEYYPTISTNIDAIEPHLFYYGTLNEVSTDLNKMVKEEKQYGTKLNIGLIQASDFVKANSNIVECGTHSLIRKNYELCKFTNWMVNGITDIQFYWTITPILNNYFIVYVNNNGNLITRSPSCNDCVSVRGFGVVPTIYLKPDINLEGEGTSSNPYKIVS